jgi:hypothetical protein
MSLMLDAASCNSGFLFYIAVIHQTLLIWLISTSVVLSVNGSLMENLTGVVLAVSCGIPFQPQDVARNAGKSGKTHSVSLMPEAAQHGVRTWTGTRDLTKSLIS